MRLIRHTVAAALLLVAGQALALDVGNLQASPQLERTTADRIQVQAAGPSHASLSFQGDAQVPMRDTASQVTRSAAESAGFSLPEPADPPGWMLLLCAAALIAFVAQRKASLLS